jgi:hypothetical protein
MVKNIRLLTLVLIIFLGAYPSLFTIIKPNDRHSYFYNQLTAAGWVFVVSIGIISALNVFVAMADDKKATREREVLEKNILEIKQALDNEGLDYDDKSKQIINRNNTQEAHGLINIQSRGGGIKQNVSFHNTSINTKHPHFELTGIDNDWLIRQLGIAEKHYKIPHSKNIRVITTPGYDKHFLAAVEQILADNNYQIIARSTLSKEPYSQVFTIVKDNNNILAVVIGKPRS